MINESTLSFISSWVHSQTLSKLETSDCLQAGFEPPYFKLSLLNEFKVTGQQNISVKVIKGYFSQTKAPFLNVRQENALFNN